MKTVVIEGSLTIESWAFGALDKETSLEIVEVFKELNAQGRTILIVTHDMDIAAMCRARYEITDGKISLAQFSRAEPDAAKII